MVREAREHLAGLGIDVDPRERMGSLSIGLQQLIEIARVLFSGARIIILDEPTSALSPPEVERLFAVLRRLKASGRSFIFISHFLDDILKISDEITIFRNGRKIVTSPVDGIDKLWVIERMIGGGHEELGETYTGEFTLNAEGRREGGAEGQRPHLSSAASRTSRFDVHAGEILGIYGFMGCGVARADARALRQDQAVRGAGARGRRAAARQHGEGAARRARLRAGEPPARCSSTTSRSTRTPRSRS